MEWWEKEYEIPEVTGANYGTAWAPDTDQVTKELAGFKNPGTRAYGTRYEHGIRLCQLLFPKDVALYVDTVDYRDGSPVRIYNSYFLDAFKDLCDHPRVSLTGAASTGKTYAIAVYSLLSFMADPQNTLVMISTTAATDSERRVWGDVKDLWRAASERYPLGTLIDYLKAITFDPARELENKRDVTHRDLGSGVCVIAIPKGSEGEKAQGKIIGTKIKKGRLIWVIEEMPHMMDDVLRPESNLESNPEYELKVTGNANRKSDPHGVVSEPTDGWDSVSVDSECWWAKDVFVRFLHGERGPNFHPAVDPSITDKRKFPFPYLSNRTFVRNVAYRNGHGRTEEECIENGKQTIDYMRFAIGFWYSDDIEPTLLSAKYVREYKADEQHVTWGYRERTVVAGFDPAFSSGGDKNSLVFFELGYDSVGSQTLWVAGHDNVRSYAESRESFRKDIAMQAVARCRARGVKPEHFFMDISGDGGLVALEVSSAFGARVNGISSLENVGEKDSRYHDVVTKLWFQAQRAVATGRLKGFDIRSGYAKDLFARRYESVGKGVVRIEPKGNKKTYDGKGFKSRVGRSPDDGDAFVYGLEGAVRIGFSLYDDPGKASSAQRKARILDRLSGQSTDAEGFVAHEEAALVTAGWEQDGWE